MNQKSCKSIRRVQRQLGIDYREVSYKPWEYFTLLLPIPHVRVKPIRRTPNCGRSIYQAMKKEHQHGV